MTGKNIQKLVGPIQASIPLGKRITEQDIQDHLLGYVIRTSKNSFIVENSITRYHLEELSGCKKGYFNVKHKLQL